MAYEALYTRARPKNLAQLVGQEHISNSLARALNQDRLSHAYLLVGTRGTGKTSTARILAKAINCDTVHISKESKENLPLKSIPCNECEACLSFKSSPDNVEFDAASNRSVEDVSRLLSTAYLAPLQSRFKTFIIDEVHMLSFEAVNSILKLIEEPPPNVIFFLATTEFNKVPMTIRSRCQILNFKLIPQDVIASHIIDLAKSLNFTLEDLAVKKIARLAKGSMRDALTFFDQCYSMTDSDKLTVDVVDTTLGLVSDADLDEIIEAARLKDRSGIIKSTAEAFKSGLTAGNIAESIVTRLRDDVARIKDSHSPELLFYNDMIDQLRKAILEMQGSGIPEVILETALFKIATNPMPNVIEKRPDISIIQTPIAPVKDNKVVDIRDHLNRSDEVDEMTEVSKVEKIDDIYDDSEFDGISEEYINSLVGIENHDENLNNAEDIIDAENEENRPEVKYPMQDGEEIINKIIEYLNQKDNFDDVITCMKLAKVVNFKSDTIFVTFKNKMMSYLFKDCIKVVESIANEIFNRGIRFQIAETEGMEGIDVETVSKEDIFSSIQMTDEDKEYLFEIMKSLNVARHEVKLLPTIDIGV